MKRGIIGGLGLGLLFSLGVLTPLSAQNRVEVFTGVSVASLGGNDADGLDSKVGFTLGGNYVLSLNEILGLSLGAAYTGKGAGAEDQGVSADIDLHYIEIPVLLRVGSAGDGSVAFHANAGPVLSFQTSCSASVSFQGETFSEDCSNSETWDLGLAGGVGASFQVNEGLSIIADLLYNLGLRDLDQETDLKNRALLFRAGVAFPVGG